MVSERTKPRVQHFLSEVFLIIGGCTKDERFISTVTCLDPLRRSRLEVARLPMTEMEDESQNRKWVEFACITFRNEVYISGERYNFTFSKDGLVTVICRGPFIVQMKVKQLLN